MDGNKAILSDDDIQKLIKSSVEKRLDVTKKIGKYYSAGGFDEDQMKIAERIFRILLKDTEVEVRKVLSESVKLSKDIPNDVVMELAKDINEVSIPVLTFSEVLTDEDLVEIIDSTQDISKQESVAQRKDVSELVSNALIETGHEKVVDKLLHNDGARVADDGYKKIIDDFSNNEKLLEAMVQREKIPVVIMEKLARTVSQEIYAKLEEKHKNKVKNFDEVMNKGQEVSAMKVMGMQSTEQEYYKFCKLMTKLHIPPDLMPISALCVGNFNLFEVCIARATKVPVLNVRELLKDTGNKGFKVLYERANLPPKLYEASEVLVDVLRDLRGELNNNGIMLSKKVANRIIGNMMMHAEERGEVENLDYIVTLIRHNVDMAEAEERESRN
ncbi:MAG: DUF2336 domain-containing protein [Rickettsiales bacterium]|nr:DUF2336 domain-containing protein [Pseudomonadota bacterium]MDA0965672.1 DUF2336 domain-containing protein [Pseudomonadota bacterium]MDG4542996.1 DUF2336 domain-containing protein [Rickettsiales bacterium]MDG4544556.1 DUF2336 domain-containing protein [Rickettsiales bacterium]MDG4546678.1 DUF2336 domain-containing protein [Rickettsiales bacterium]